MLQVRITGREFFPDLISGPFQDGLVVVFALATGLTVLAALASALRGGQRVPPPDPAKGPDPASSRTPAGRGDPGETGGFERLIDALRASLS